MIVLGIDTATAATAVALRLGDGSTRELRDDPAAGEHPGHATRLLEMAASLLCNAGVRWSELERLAVGVGPGAFTGLRVGIATARGLAQSLSLQLVGVSSLMALAEAAGTPPALAEGVARVPARDAVLAVIDARRGEVFAAAYEPAAGGEPTELAAARALAPAQLAELVQEVERGDDGAPRRWLALGDGAVRYRPHLSDTGAAVPEDSSPLHRVSAAAICAAGARALQPPGYGEIVPDYRRRPDAELALQGTAAARSPRR